MKGFSFKVLRSKADGGFNAIKRADNEAQYDLVSVTVRTPKGDEIDVAIQFRGTNQFDIYTISSNYELVPQCGHSHRFKLRKVSE